MLLPHRCTQPVDLPLSLGKVTTQRPVLDSSRLLEPRPLRSREDGVFDGKDKQAARPKGPEDLSESRLEVDEVVPKFAHRSVSPASKPDGSCRNQPRLPKSLCGGHCDIIWRRGCRLGFFCWLRSRLVFWCSLVVCRVRDP